MNFVIDGTAAELGIVNTIVMTARIAIEARSCATRLVDIRGINLPRKVRWTGISIVAE